MILIGLFLLLVLFFNVIRWNDIALAKTTSRAPWSASINGLYEPIDEQSFVAFDMSDTTLRLNEIRMIASHNSYKKQGSPLGKLFVGLGDSWKEAAALQYDNPDLTFQLNSGIRSFELDVRYRLGDFEAVHVPLVDNSSTAVKLALAFQEIALWSEHNANHIPVILLIGNQVRLDDARSVPGLHRFARIATARPTARRHVWRFAVHAGGFARHVRHLATSPRAPKAGRSFSEMLGKVIVVMHPGRMTAEYAASDPDFNEIAMFPAVQNLDVDYPLRRVCRP
ncbi:MAG: Ca2+-dependent phosphoinositide-specific phospholipase C [Bacillus subtilis]|nr:Ca2+-dependent phosphoinositide-specific phospholipase C [Bacillus subtilis]